MYVSPENMMMSVVWVAVVIGIIILLKRKKEQLQKIDDIGV
jgi:threonine/homoserine efflux transporter RhtA